MRCAQFAWNRSEQGIVLVSVAGPQTAVKSLLAALNQNVRLEVSVWEGADNDGRPLPRYSRFTRMGSQGSYRIATHRLGFHAVHATAVLKHEALLPALTPEAVWNALSSRRFTTPVLREWVPWLMRQMEAEGELVALPAFQCRPGLLRLDDAGLDAHVSRGLKQGELEIPRKGVL
jgi:hypothetical protein